VKAGRVVESSQFRKFEDSAFFGKLGTTLFGVVFEELLGDQVEREHLFGRHHVDFLIKGVGFVELTMSKKPDVDSRSNWYRESRENRVYVLAPERLKESYKQTMRLDFKVPNAKKDLPPEDAKQSNIAVVSFMELFATIEKKIDRPGFLIAATSKLNQESVARMGQGLAAEWYRAFFGP
jgi:hypothetical protein